MSIAFLILQQISIMLLLTTVGYLMFRFRKITEEGSKSIGNILLYLSLPCVIIKSFLLERTSERIVGLLMSSVLALVVLLLSMVISSALFRSNPIETFAAAFSNPGFFGIPLIVASLSDGAVFYVAAFIAFLNLFQWTYGVSLLTKGHMGEPSPKGSLISRFVKAPFMVAILIGLFFFLSGFTMPSILQQCILHIANLNTPLAMFTIGIYLAQTDIMKMFTKPRLYLVSLVRMILIPLVTLCILCFLPNNWQELKIALLIASACPVGSNVAVYAQLHNKDYPYAVETVVLSTVCSIVTLPLIMQLATFLWL